MLPLYILEAIEEAGYPLPCLDVNKSQSKQERYSDMEGKKENYYEN